MPYIGNVLTSFAVETGNINDQAVTAPKLSATGGTDGQVLALDSNLNLEWVSDPAGQWVTGDSNVLTYSEGDVGIGVTAPTSILDVRDNQDGDAAEIKLFNLDQGNTTTQTAALVMTPDVRANGAEISVVKENADFTANADKDVAITFAPVLNNAAAERMRIDSSGRLLIGTTAAATAVPPSESTASLLQVSATNNPVSIGLVRSDTSITNGNIFGGIHWYGTDTTSNTPTIHASIQAAADGDHAAGDNPSRLTFSTTADGAATVTEQLRISSDGTVAVTDNLTVNGVQYPDAGPLSNRNLIINGAMNVAQRGTTQANVADSASEGYNTIDRFGIHFANSAGGVCTINQSTTTPTLTQGSFSHSYHVDVTTADTSLAANHYIVVFQFIEAQDIRNSGWDFTNTNSRLTLSFWARSSLAGTYCCHLRQEDVTSRYYTFEYTLEADTWLHVTHSVPGDASAEFDDNANAGLRVGWMLAAGTDRDNATANQWATNIGNPATSNQVNFFNNTANDFFLTGVQLEVGDQATPFEHRTFGDDLDKCKRYFQRYTNTTGSAFTTGINGIFNSDTQCAHAFPFQKTMRAAPSFAISQTSDFDLEPFDEQPDSAPTLFGTPSTDIAIIEATSPTSRTKGFASMLTIDVANGFFEFDAEL